MTDLDQTYHYKVMRRAIAVIDARGDGLSLPELAAEMGMSAAHFQRLFSHWVGVSPKRYQQYLALGHAKTLLAQRSTTLEAAEASGLSGGGRLHDLFLKWESMSPGTFARQGEGLTVHYGWFDSPFGMALAMGTDRGLCGLAFADEIGRDATFADMCARWPRVVPVHAPDRIAPWVDAAFAGHGDVHCQIVGAPFQIKVWEALLAIPSGHVTTYSSIAQAIGHPNAVRAVGTAVGRNPISYLIPCHRALRKSGGLGGYHWGLPVKRAILARESAQTEM
jgi:AraC family transcriptional regulator of adaptative response/methylated-DNA-[protein]-cysteine methyltransferase